MGRRESGRMWSFMPFLAVGIVALAVLAVLTFREAQGRLSNPPISQWVAFTLTVSLIGALVAFWLPRRQRGSSLAAVTALSLAIVTLVLGGAAYLPCHQDGLPLFVAPVGWTLELFVGGVEASPSPGEVCVAVQSPGFTLARTFGLLATFVGAISAAAVLGRDQIGRIRVRMGADIDAVVGLSPQSLELVRALVDEHRNSRPRESWIDWRPGIIRRFSERGEIPTPPEPLVARTDPPHNGEQAETTPRVPNQTMRERVSRLTCNLTGLRGGDLRRWLTRPTRVVVLESDDLNPLLSEARTTGAIVLNADPSDPAILRGVITRLLWFGFGRRRLSLRRMFIVTERQQSNIEIHRQAVSILRDDLASHPLDVVPRLFVRIDDHRYARRWRLENVADTVDAVLVPETDGGYQPPAGTYFSDALSNTDAVAEAIAEQFIPAIESVQWRTSKVVLIGDDAFALQLLEELTWQQWCRYEVAHEALRNHQEQLDELSRSVVLWVDPEVQQQWAAAGGSNHLDIHSGVDTGATKLAALRPPSRDSKQARQDTDEVLGEFVPRAGGYRLTGKTDDVLGVLRLLAEGRSRLLRQRELLEQTLARAAHPNLREVVLAGAKSKQRVAEWHRSRHPWSLGEGIDSQPGLFIVTAASDDWEDLSRTTLRDTDAAIIFVEDRPEYRSAAARLADEHPEDFVIMRNRTSVGLQHPIATGAPYRFGPSLTRRMSGLEESCVPMDSLARLARQQHTVYLSRWPALPSAEHLVDGRTAKITSRDWPSLPDFFQEDNVRQHRALMGWFVGQGFRWVAAGSDSLPAHDVVALTQLNDLISHEYRRWSSLRRTRGWVSVGTRDDRNDSLRQHQDLRGERFIDLEFNRGLMKQIMQRLWAVGLTVEPLLRLERRGTVTAVRLAHAWTWQTPAGDVLSSEAGDWWVTDEEGDSRGMRDSTFRRMHKQGPTPDLWRRTGQVWARQVEHREIVATREGTAVAAAGMWIITAPSGDQWPVSDAAKQHGYVPATTVPQTEEGRDDAQTGA